VATTAKPLGLSTVLHEGNSVGATAVGDGDAPDGGADGNADGNPDGSVDGSADGDGDCVDSPALLQPTTRNASTTPSVLMGALVARRRGWGAILVTGLPCWAKSTINQYPNASVRFTARHRPFVDGHAPAGRELPSDITSPRFCR